MYKNCALNSDSALKLRNEEEKGSYYCTPELLSLDKIITIKERNRSKEN